VLTAYNLTVIMTAATFKKIAMAMAIVKMKPHHATVVQIAGESYRLKDKRRAGIMARPHNTKEMKEQTV